MGLVTVWSFLDTAAGLEPSQESSHQAGTASGKESDTVQCLDAKITMIMLILGQVSLWVRSRV